MAAVTPSPHPSEQVLWLNRQVVISALGNFLEFFDFALYGALTPVMAALFFPPDAPGMLWALMVFMVGFVARPLGALFFGRRADQRGRRHVLLVTVSLMATATMVMGALPTYAQVGLWAPCLLILCRVVQGMSAGGEGYGSMIFALEHWPVSHHGRVAALISASAVSGVLMASALVAVVGRFYPLIEVWRVLFFVVGLVGFATVLARRFLRETPLFESSSRWSVPQQKFLPGTSENDSWHAWLRSLFLSCGVGGLQLTLASYLSLYVAQYRSIPWVAASGWLTAVLIVYLVFLRVAGSVVDRVGHRRTLAGASMGAALVAFPLFLSLLHASFTVAFLVTLLYAFLTAMTTAAKGGMMFSLFPTSVRAQRATLSYALGTAVFGGGGPLLNQWMIARTGVTLIPGLFIVLCACLIAASVVMAPKDRQAL